MVANTVDSLSKMSKSSISHAPKRDVQKHHPCTILQVSRYPRLSNLWKMYEKVQNMILPSGSSSLVTPNSFSAMVKAMSRFSLGACRATCRKSTKSGLQADTISDINCAEIYIMVM